VKWERKDWLVFVSTKVAFLWLFVLWGVEWERTLIVWVRFSSGSMAGSVRFGFGSSPISTVDVVAACKAVQVAREQP